jgi:hypothetical protein
MKPTTVICLNNYEHYSQFYRPSVNWYNNRLITFLRAQPASYMTHSRELFHQGESDRGVNLINHLRLMPRLRMAELYRHSYDTPSWRGA